MAALNTIERLEIEKARIMFVKNTLELDVMKASPAIVDEVRHNPSVEIEEQGFDLEFDSQGNIRQDWSRRH